MKLWKVTRIADLTFWIVKASSGSDAIAYVMLKLLSATGQDPGVSTDYQATDRVWV